MTIEEFKQEKIIEHNKLIAHIDSLTPVIESVKDKIRFISNGTIFVNEVKTFDEVLEMIHGQKFELDSYYSCSNGCLSIGYAIGGISYQFCVRDAEDALKRVSGGKCHMEKVAVASENVVRCNMDGEA